jgi:hypothetical protein
MNIQLYPSITLYIIDFIRINDIKCITFPKFYCPDVIKKIRHAFPDLLIKIRDYEDENLFEESDSSINIVFDQFARLDIKKFKKYKRKIILDCAYSFFNPYEFDDINVITSLPKITNIPYGAIVLNANFRKIYNQGSKFFYKLNLTKSFLKNLILDSFSTKFRNRLIINKSKNNINKTDIKKYVPPINNLEKILRFNKNLKKQYTFCSNILRENNFIHDEVFNDQIFSKFIAIDVQDKIFAGQLYKYLYNKGINFRPLWPIKGRYKHIIIDTNSL